MTELSFNTHADCMSNQTDSQDVDDSGISLDVEKHVTIDEELPVIYKPKSFSVPDLLDENEFQHSRHQHPALKFSTSNNSADYTFFKKFFPREKQTSCSPFMQRKVRVDDKTKKDELTRQRGKTFDEFTYGGSAKDTASSDCENNERKRRSFSAGSFDSKWSSFIKKVNILPRFSKSKSRKKKECSFYDLPLPIKCTTSSSMAAIKDRETNNNSNVQASDEGCFFNTSKSYKPTTTEQNLLSDSRESNTGVKLKRIKSLPLL